MRRLLSKRVLGWFLFVGVLIALGIAIYRTESHEPRWTAGPLRTNGAKNFSLPLQSSHFSPDGRKIFSIHAPNEIGWENMQSLVFVRDQERGLQSWDVASGKPLPKHPREGCLAGFHTFSADRRQFAGDFLRVISSAGQERVGYFLCVADLHTGTERVLSLDGLREAGDVRFSPAGEYLALHAWHIDQKSTVIRIYAARSGELLAELPSLGGEFRWFLTDDFLIYSTDGMPNSDLVLWSLAERKNVGTLENAASFPQLSHDGRWLLSVSRADDDPDTVWRIWNLRERKLQAEFTSEARRHGVFAPNGEWAILRSYGKTRTIELRELATGKQLAHIPGEKVGDTLVFSPDSRYLAIGDHFVNFGGLQHGLCGLRVFDLPNLKEIWQSGNGAEGQFSFSPDSKKLIHGSAFSKETRLLDSATGGLVGKIEFPNSGMAVFQPTTDGRTLLVNCSDQMLLWDIFGLPEPWWKRTLRSIGMHPENFQPKYRDEFVVYDLEGNRERLRLRRWNISQGLLSDDGRTLITTHEEPEGRLVRCWDVDALKPLRWPLGVPIGVGVALYLLASGYGLWRRRRVVSAAPPADKSI